jgi:hypothetical protein
MRALQPIETAVKSLFINVSWSASKLAAARQEPAAAEFCRKVEAETYRMDFIRVLPEHDLIYLIVPKVANTSIRTTLAAIDGRPSRRLLSDRGGFRARTPRNMTARSFYRLATSPTALRFSFVRNPYAKLVSLWAAHIRDRPLVPGEEEMVDSYLSRRAQVDPKLPVGAERTLSFEAFVTFSEAVASARHHPNFQLQSDLLTVPGVTLNFVGRLESFNTDFVRVLDHVGASEAVRRDAFVPLNASQHKKWSDYYTPELADRVYRAYERDFDRFSYPRSMPS